MNIFIYTDAYPILYPPKYLLSTFKNPEKIIPPYSLVLESFVKC